MFKLGRSNSDSKRKSLAVRQKARESMARAKSQHLEARKASKWHMNEYSRGDKSVVEKKSRAARLASTKKWYEFYKKDRREMPVDLLLPNNEKATYVDAAISVLEEVIEASEENKGWSEPSSVFWLNKNFVQQSCKPRSKNGMVYFRIKATLAAAPKDILLTQVRSDLYGQTDPSLIYQKEHYSYRGGKTMLFQSVYDPPMKFASARDSCELLSFDEHPDGVILVGRKSIMNTVEHVSGVVRTVTHIRGMVIKPAKVEVKGLFGSTTVDGSEVTYIQMVDPKGMLPKSMGALVSKKAAAERLLNAEIVAQEVAKDKYHQKMIKKFVEQALDDSDDEEDEEQPQN